MRQHTIPLFVRFLAVAALTLLIPPQAARAADPAWRGEYYPNRFLAGEPALVRDDPAIEFDWGTSSPAYNVPSDDFSVRWTRNVVFEGGRYRFNVQVDDGVRLFLDGQLIIDAWQEQTANVFAERNLTSGDHSLRLEYYERGGGAMVRLNWTRTDQPPPPPAGLWRGEYYANRFLSGGPTVVRDDPALDFNWGLGSPDSRLPADNFSVRWNRTLNLEGGRYRFAALSDDGVRLFVDGALVIDAWRDQAPSTFTAERDLAGGSHTLRVEYYEASAGAVLRLTFARVNTAPVPDDAWRGEYYGNRSLSGAPTVVRPDAKLDFNWGSGSPDAGLPADNFSARWTRRVRFDGGRWRFTTLTDDGVRFWIDGRLIIDRWQDLPRATTTAETNLNAGVHELRLEYYEGGGAASARLTWDKVRQPLVVGNIVSCVRPTNSWLKVYRLEGSNWVDTNPRGYGPVSRSGYIKIDGLPVESARYGSAGHPYRVELWANNVKIRAVGYTARGEPEFRVRANADTRTPWGCPAP